MPNKKLVKTPVQPQPERKIQSVLGMRLAQLVLDRRRLYYKLAEKEQELLKIKADIQVFGMEAPWKRKKH